ncbi:MAG: putative urea ABC transporter substrate-binding protein [Methylococcaceae bacterium]|nr:putative urea ABC transporter substrate-binding protein [Methylococcaceae bacterium]
MRRLFSSLILILGMLMMPISSNAADKFKACWSHYTGWEPWGYAYDKGILKKWANKYGIEIEMTLINDYVESINLYTAGEFDACTMTNMDALTIPAVGGIDSTALIIGDYSNGNDGIVIKGGDSINALRGREILLVELSVSHYLLARALDSVGMTERDVKLINTSDADIASIFIATAGAATVTWNPPLQQVRNAKGATMVFDSSKTPGEILDLMVVKTDADMRFKKALVGAWYETLSHLTAGGQQADVAISYMAKESGATVAEFKSQLKTTRLFPDPMQAAAIAENQQIKQTMEHVRQFSFEKGLFGQGAASVDFVGIAFPDQTILGSKRNVKFRFDSQFMKMAGQGKL